MPRYEQPSTPQGPDKQSGEAMTTAPDPVEGFFAQCPENPEFDLRLLEQLSAEGYSIPDQNQAEQA